MKWQKSGSVAEYLLAILALLLATSCSDFPPPPVEPTVQEAFDSLGAVLSATDGSFFDPGDADYTGFDSSFRPRDIDFTGVEAVFRSAFNANSTNNDAKFGLGFTGALVFLSDPTFNSLIDRFKNVFDTMGFNPFNPSAIVGLVDFGQDLSPAGLPLNSAGLMGVLPSAMRLDRSIMASAATTPLISELQTNMENSMLPRVKESRRLLSEILSIEGYKFMLTPERQGNPGADTLIFDRAVLQTLVATLYGAEAALRIFFARDLDLPAYTVDAAQAAADQNSTYLDLKPDGQGATNMATAGAMIDSTTVMLDSAISSLLAEIGSDQSRDFLRVFEKDRLGLVEARDSLRSLHQSLTMGPRIMNFKLYTPYLEPPRILSANVDLRKFFDAPMDNPKRFLPTYTASVTAVPDLFKSFAAEHYSRDRYWFLLDSLFGLTQPNDTPFFSTHLPDVDNDQFYQMLAERSMFGSSSPFILGWDDAYSYCAGCGGDVLIHYQSGNSYRYSYLYSKPDQVAYCFNWAADSYDTWNWLKPKFNGLLPDMTSDEIKNILTAKLDLIWSKSNCDTVGLSIN